MKSNLVERFSREISTNNIFFTNKKNHLYKYTEILLEKMDINGRSTKFSNPYSQDLELQTKLKTNQITDLTSTTELNLDATNAEFIVAGNLKVNGSNVITAATSSLDLDDAYNNGSVVAVDDTDVEFNVTANNKFGINLSTGSDTFNIKSGIFSDIFTATGGASPSVTIHVNETVIKRIGGSDTFKIGSNGEVEIKPDWPSAFTTTLENSADMIVNFESSATGSFQVQDQTVKKLEITKAGVLTLPEIDTVSGALTIGATNASAVNISQSTDVTTIKGLLTVDEASTFTGVVSIDNATQSTSTVTGSIHTDGGLGVVKDVFIGGVVDVANDLTVTDGTNNIFEVDVSSHTAKLGNTAEATNDTMFHVQSDQEARLWLEADADNDSGEEQAFILLTQDNQARYGRVYLDSGNLLTLEGGSAGGSSTGAIQFYTDGNNTAGGAGTYPTFVSPGTLTCKMLSTDISPGTTNAIDLGTSSLEYKDIYSVNAVTVSSDKRGKKDIVDSDLGLEFINKLAPKKYKLKGGKRHHYGLISQDVEELLNKDNIDFAGFVKSPIYEEVEREGEMMKTDKVVDYKYALRYGEFISPLIKAIQELQEKVELLEQHVIG